MYRTIVGIGVENALKDAGQGSTELNGSGWSKAERLGVDLGESVVYDCPRPTMTLLDNPYWTHAQILEASHALVGKEDPLAFVHQLDKLVFKKVEVLES
jgi:hypothetical protein